MDDFNNTLAASTVISDAREHPFFPIDAYVPDYVATSTPTAILLTIFFGTVAAILALSKVSLTHFNRNLSNSDLWTTSWFILCGFIHTFFEGVYLPYSYPSMAIGNFVKQVISRIISSISAAGPIYLANSGKNMLSQTLAT